MKYKYVKFEIGYVVPDEPEAIKFIKRQIELDVLNATRDDLSANFQVIDVEDDREEEVPTWVWQYLFPETTPHMLAADGYELQKDYDPIDP